MKATQGVRPDITAAQVAGTVTAGVPIVASLLSAFGLYTLSPEQQDALSNAVQWASIFAASLVGGDAALRTARNKRIGAVEAVLANGGETDLEVVRRAVNTSVATEAPGGKTGFETPQT